MSGSLKLYTIQRVDDGRFFYEMPFGNKFGWYASPNIHSLSRDRDEIAGWKHNVSRSSMCDCEIKVCELTVTWE